MADKLNCGKETRKREIWKSYSKQALNGELSARDHISNARDSVVDGDKYRNRVQWKRKRKPLLSKLSSLITKEASLLRLGFVGALSKLYVRIEK